MSLTNYISQSVMGVTIYYGFGLSMYKYAGATAMPAYCIAYLYRSVGLQPLVACSTQARTT